MAGKTSGSKGRRRRVLTPQEKYEVWTAYLAGEGTQAELADKWGVDRSTVAHLIKTAKDGALDRLAAARPGRPGQDRPRQRAGGRPRRDRQVEGHGV